MGVRALADLEIKGCKSWVLSARLASTFRRQRIFLAGDAAHCFPPTGGLGLNTGVQDAHNLAWKLAAVLRGRAQIGLLDTYETERRPVAHDNLEHSVRNYERMNDLTLVAGLDNRRLRWLQRGQTSRLFSWLPRTWQRSLVTAAVKHATGKLASLDKEGPKADALRARFQLLLPAQMPHYRCLGLDLGFAYRHGAVIAEDTRKPEAADPVMDYRPTTWPGARLPHLWVVREQTRVAIHDLLEPNGMLLLTQPAGRAVWQAAIEAARKSFALALTCMSIGRSAEADLFDEHDVWVGLSEVDPSGVAVLVRPDGHVAWRCREAPPNAGAVLEAMLTRLGWRDRQESLCSSWGLRQGHGPDGSSNRFT